MNSKVDTVLWARRYGHQCPRERGKIVAIAGVGRKDTYNVAMFEQNGQQVMAFRCEQRRSFAWHRRVYHPQVYFARPGADGKWRVDDTVPPFDMMEDPFFFAITTGERQEVVLGGVEIRREGHSVIPQTKLYRGQSLQALERQPFMVIDDMKDVRLLQLPDGRFLLCRRPWGGQYGRGRITLHIIDTLDDINQQLPALAVLDGCIDQKHWVGINQAQILTDQSGVVWIGLLGHVAFMRLGRKHYAACTYKIKLSELVGANVSKACPRLIASRACFEPGPAKKRGFTDIVFPGHIEHLTGITYRLWAGLSDTRIGMFEIDDPFGLAKES